MTGQSRLMSLAESAVSTGIGFSVAVATQVAIFPLFGINVALSDNFAIAAVFTAISIVRSYVVRRLFNLLHLRRWAHIQELWCNPR